jgi:coenzyme F420-reducing hydrogenase delta subunit/Pyruvate/2-oxoacid:ferredoxin oxidoreductase delta subunit
MADHTCGPLVVKGSQMVENVNLEPPLVNAQSTDVIIFGSGVCAQKTAANLAHYGIKTCVATKGQRAPAPMPEDKITWLTGAQLMDCKGFAGDFKLVLNQDNAIFRTEASAIVVAEDQMAMPNYESYGLASNERVLDITSLEEKMRNASPDAFFQEGARIAFLCGWQIDSHPVIAQRMLYCCLKLQGEPKISTMFMTGNLKVAANGAEALYHEAKKAGTVFLKFTHTFPNIQVIADGRFDIDYQDELTRTPFGMTADWIIVDETIGPGHGLKGLVQKLDIEKDEQGFAQIDNVHRLSHSTNRRGIFVAGGARGVSSRDEQQTDADQVTVKVLAFLKNEDIESLPKVEIQQGRCARCLTCHRLCPHKAIDIGQQICVVPHACQGCGICLAGCPARAIEMDGLQISTDSKAWRQPPPPHGEHPKTIPNVWVLGCSRSAGQALQLTRTMGCVMPPGVRFIEVPCSGSISSRHLLAAFDAGTDGVMLCTCHTDNCMSDRGNRLARKRADSALYLLKAAGIEKDRLEVSSLAANMANEFYLRVNEFVERIRSLNTGTHHNPIIEDDHHGSKNTGSY